MTENDLGHPERGLTTFDPENEAEKRVPTSRIKLGERYEVQIMKNILKILVLTFAILSIFGTMAVNAAPYDDPFSTLFYENVSATNKADGPLSVDVSVSGIESDGYNVGDIATFSITVANNGNGDRNDNTNKDLLFVLYDVNGSVLTTYPSPMTPMNIDTVHLGVGDSFSLNGSYDLTSATPNTSIVLPYIVYDYGQFMDTTTEAQPGDSDWAHTEIAYGTIVLKVNETKFSVKIKGTIYELLDEILEVNNEAGYVKVYTDINEIGNTNGNKLTAQLTDGTKVYLEAIANEGYAFYDWKYNYENELDDSDSNYRPNPRYVVVSEKNASLSPTPVFYKKDSGEDGNEEENQKYEIHFDSNGGIFENPTLEYQYGNVDGSDSAIEPIVTRDGFVFDGWNYPEGLSVNPITASGTVTAQWSEVEVIEETPTVVTPVTTYYTLTVEATEGGTVPGFMGQGSYASGTRVNLSVVAEEGYEFVGWTGSVESNVVIMNSNQNVTAVFELIIADEEVAEGTPDPESSANVEDDETLDSSGDILDENIPEASGDEAIPDESLPQTGGIPLEAASIVGLITSLIGIYLKKK